MDREGRAQEDKDSWLDARASPSQSKMKGPGGRGTQAGGHCWVSSPSPSGGQDGLWWTVSHSGETDRQTQGSAARRLSPSPRSPHQLLVL